jgi:hypothetical protein
MVHVLLSMLNPSGSEGETLQVASLTLIMPLPEPLFATVEEFQMLLPETKTGESWLKVPSPPSPSCPQLSAPQHFRSPLSRMAQVW